MNALILYLRQLNMASMILRIFLAMLLGGTVGLERARKGRAAGFRTYMFVALGASMTMLLSEYYAELFHGPWSDLAASLGVKTDVSRFGAQVINGVGFLGAGTVIITARQEVKGLTTAAGLWASACIGLAIGAGFYEGVLVAFILLTVCLRVLPSLEDSILARTRDLNVYIELENMNVLSAVIAYLKQNNVLIYDVDVGKDKHDHVSQINALLNLKLPERNLHGEILAMISTTEGVITVDEI